MSYLVSATLVFIIILGIVSVSSGQQQVVVNPDFEYGLLGWNVSVVKSFRDPLRPDYSYPRIEPIASCKDYMPSYDGYCVFFNVIYSEVYVWQTLYIPDGKADLEVKYKKEKDDIVIYIELIELTTGKVERYWLDPYIAKDVRRLSISHLSGKNIELRFGVDGKKCYNFCPVYADYVRILVYPTPTTTQTVFAVTTTTLTHVKTYTYSTTTHTTVTTSITEANTYTHILSVTEEKTETIILTTTIKLTKAMAQLDGTLSVEELQYISIIGALTVAIGFFMLIYEGLRLLNERKTWRIALGFALPYAFFAGIIVWQIIPLFFRPASLISILVDYVNFLLMLAFLVVFIIPTVIVLYYIRMLRHRSKRGASN